LLADTCVRTAAGGRTRRSPQSGEKTRTLNVLKMEDQRQYCLKWNNHPKNIATVFDRLRLEELFVDVTLATSDRQIIRAHRVLLSAGSGYLEKVLAMNPSDHPTVVLSNIRYKELKLLVDFMYSGEIAVDQQQFPSLLEAAKSLKIRGLYEDSDDVQEDEDTLEAKSNAVSNNSTPELTVTKNEPKEQVTLPTTEMKLTCPRKRSHSEESEEEPIQSPDDAADKIDDDNSYEGAPAKFYKPMYGPINGVSNAVWMMSHKSEKKGTTDSEEAATDKEKDAIPDIPNLMNFVNHSSSNIDQQSAQKSMLSPTNLNEQFLQAMQLCGNPYYNTMAAMQKPLDLLSTTFNGTFTGMSPFKSNLSPNSKQPGLLNSAPVRRYKQYSEDSLQAALKEIMNGQSINRSSHKHNIPARTLRDWMKRLNIKSVYTHHSHNKERSTSQDGTEEDSASSTNTSPEPRSSIDLTSPIFGSTNNAVFTSPQNGSAFPGMKSNPIKEEDEIDDDEDGTLKIDEGPITNITQIAQEAN